MSWIQENKFTAGVLGAAVVVSGVLFYLGYSARSEAETIRESANAAVSETNGLKRKKPFPSSDNKQLVVTKVSNFTEEALEFGVIGINTGITSYEGAPFGGFKASGTGREGSHFGISEFLEIKYLCIAEIGA